MAPNVLEKVEELYEKVKKEGGETYYSPNVACLN